jgi:hypothetical protein
MEAGILGLGGVVLGALLGWLFTLHAANSAAKRADALRKGEAGRAHAKVALDIIRNARNESWRRKPEGMSHAIDTRGLRLDEAEAEISLIPDAVLRTRLLGALSAVRYPWNLDLGYPVTFQRSGLYGLREALSAYIREEPTPKVDKELDDMGRSVNEYHEAIEAAEKKHQEKKHQEKMRLEQQAGSADGDADPQG